MVAHGPHRKARVGVDSTATATAAAASASVWRRASPGGTRNDDVAFGPRGARLDDDIVLLLLPLPLLLRLVLVGELGRGDKDFVFVFVKVTAMEPRVCGVTTVGTIAARQCRGVVLMRMMVMAVMLLLLLLSVPHH